ncbi:MAG TPA: 3-phosphoshikimate 1-carboxyvinyltransferase [Steroidobacteraceae bacterium]|nr:3-phosphoshikimate 1-carboxyvinyltransferase [Steroidobacteraceae bacterium]
MSADAAAGAPVLRYRVQPGGRIAGTLTVPGDKSISHRALMLGAIADGDTHITGFLNGEDCLSTARALGQLGVRIERPEPTEVLVHGVGAAGLTGSATALDMGNAGTAMRLFTGLLAPQRFHSTLIGDESLMRRPMQRVVVPLAMMGAQIRTHDGRPPVEIRGTPHLRAIHYSLPVASAQVKSAVLLAGLYAAGRTHVTEPAPSRDHTERMLAAFGVELGHEGRSIALDGGQTLKGTSIAVPADFSSAAFFIVAACLAASPSLQLTNVGVNPTRTGLIDLLRRMGADIRVRARAGSPGGEPVADLEIRQSELHGITVAEAEVPLSIDEFPVFFIAAACATGETLVRGALELRVKESDRLAAMAAGLGALGVENQLLPDGLWIRGAEGLTGGTIDSHGDHRIAMAFAVAGLRASAPIEILDVANVATSFPGFVETGRAAGLGLEAL